MARRASLEAATGDESKTVVATPVTDPLPAGASRSRLWRLPGALAWARAEGRPALGALLLYIAGAIALTASAWAAPTTRWIGSCCDPEQTIWFLRWVPYAIAHGTNPLFTGLLNAPNGVNLMWNASTPLLGLAALPITLLGGPILAYNVLMTVAVVLDAWCARLALQRYANGIVGPIVGGAVYGFSPFVVPHAALHLNLATALAPPLFLILLDEILVRRRRPAWLLGIAVGFVAAFQLLTAEELLATSAIAAIVFVGVLAACRPAQIRAGLRRLLPASVTAATTFILLAAWPLAAQFLGRQRIGGRVQDADSFATDLLNLVLPTRYQLIAPAAATQISDHFSGLFHEAGAYVGLPLLLVLAAVVARHWDDLRARVAALTGAIIFVLSLGPHLHVGGESTGWPLPWLPFAEAPLLENVLPGRFAVFLWLAVGAIVAITIDQTFGYRWRRAAPRLAAITVALALVIPAPLTSSTTAIPAFFANWGREGIRPDATVLIAPFFRDGAGADPMVWAAVAGDQVRMPEAYAYVPGADGLASYGPPGTQLSDIMEAIQDRGSTIVARGDVRAEVAADLRTKGITDVIVGPMGQRAQMVAFFTDLFGRPPVEVDGVEIWRNVDQTGVAPSP
jgi:hypothetical protein